MTGFKTLSFAEVLLFFALSILAEIFESFTFYLGAKKSPHFKTTLIFSFIGAIFLAPVMAVIIPAVGIIVGTFLGTYLGAVLAQVIHKEELTAALAAGARVLWLRLAALAVKLTVFSFISVRLIQSLF